jgi:hypothetical protein
MTAGELDDLLVHAKEHNEAVVFTPPNGWELVPMPPVNAPVMPYFLDDSYYIFDEDEVP